MISASAESIIYPTIGMLLILAGMTSVVLNPISMYFHVQMKRNSLSGKLFCWLAINDFIINLVQPFFAGSNFIIGRLDDKHTPSKSFQIFLNLITYSQIRVAVVIVSLIAIVRFIKIKYPFYHIKSKIVLATLATSQLSFIAQIIYDLLKSELFWCSPVQFPFVNFRPDDLTDTTSVLREIPALVLMVVILLGLAFSLGSIIMILRRGYIGGEQGIQKQLQKDAVKVSSALILSNLPTPIIALVIFFYSDALFCSYDKVGNTTVVFLKHYGWSTILAATNPLILLIFSSEIRAFVADKVKNMHITCSLRTFGRSNIT